MCRYLQSSTIFLLIVVAAPLYSSNYAQLIGQTTSCSYPLKQQSLINNLIQTNVTQSLIYPKIELLLQHNIELLLQHKVDPNLQNRDGNTICHLYYNQNFDGTTIEEQRIKIFTDNLMVLLKNNADFSLKNRDGDTPLHMRTAAKYLDLPTVYPTLDKQGALNIPNNKGVTPFMMFIAKSVTHSATQCVLTHLKNHLYAPSNALITDKKANNMLHYLVRHRNLTPKEIKTLYNDYAKILHVKNKNGRSALDMFCYDLPPSERYMLEKELGLEKGFLKYIVDERGNTFLHRYLWLCNKYSVSVVRIPELLKLTEGQITQKNIYGQTPLHFFMKTYHFSRNIDDFMALFPEGFLTKKLLNTQDNKGNTVLYTLFRNCHFYPELIPYVLRQEPDLTIPNKSGNTPMHALIHLLANNAYLIDLGATNRFLHPDDTTYEKPIILSRSFLHLLRVKNNRGEGPICYSFNKNCRISARRIGIMVLDRLKDDERLRSIRKTVSYRTPYERNLFDSYFCFYDSSLTQVNERMMDFMKTTRPFNDKFIVERLYETMIYVDRKYMKYMKYMKYSSDQAHAVWIINHLRETTLKDYVVPSPLLKLIVSFLPCPLSMSINNVINKLVNNVAVTEQDLLALQKSARDFRLVDYRLANHITRCCRIIPKR